jgi:phosphatidylinositol phospholipase C beta
LFSEAIHAINEAAFKTSPYPVLLSFENFCSRRMQEKMVKYLVEILGDQLLTEPLSNYPVKEY